MHMPDHKTSFASRSEERRCRVQMEKRKLKVNMRLKCIECGDDVVFDINTPNHCVLDGREDIPLTEFVDLHECGCGHLEVMTFKKENE